jgi:hypothetical protein
MKATAFFLVLVALVLLASAALAANGLAIPRQLIGGGGGSIQSGTFALQGSVGQAVAGGVGHGSFGVGSGFWRETVRIYPVYLPLVVRNSS